MAAAALPSDLAYDRIQVVFTDLDGTLYPGDHEEEPKDKKPGLARNMEQVALLEAAGIPVIPATGNNVAFAQKKLLDLEGNKLRDLSTTPGIYCNGGLVLGQGGKEIDAKDLGAFVPSFLDKWLDPSSAAPKSASVCICGLTKSKALYLRWDGLGAAGEQVGNEFVELMMIDPEPEGFKWLSPLAFRAEGSSILSFLMLLPKDTSTDDLLAMQSWLQEADLLQFTSPKERCSNGAGKGVICKHVHVPGIGPEIDISPSGVNKGSAIALMLKDANSSLGVDVDHHEGHSVAVFGDAGNDVELFGMRRDSAGSALEPLGLGYRPQIRVAMPWANDELLLKDANVVSTMDRVLARIHETTPGRVQTKVTASASAFARAAKADAKAADAFAAGVAEIDMTTFASIIRNCRMDCRGTVMVSGVGKSGLVAKRMAASLSSIGIPASYVHGTEWVHGELGVLRPGDCIVTFSNSGETREMVQLMNHCRTQDRGVKILAIVGKPGSTMEKLSDSALVYPTIPADSPELNGNIPTRSVVMQEMAVNAVLSEMVQPFVIDAKILLRNVPGGHAEMGDRTSKLAAPSAFARSAAADALAAHAFEKFAGKSDQTAFVNALFECKGTVHMSGVGKSGNVANRMTISLMSTGTPSSYVHGTEWVHGDLGVLRAGDCVVAFSQSGECQELIDMMNICRKQDRNVKLMAILGKPGSSMERLADHVMVLPSVPPTCELIADGAIPTRSVVMQEMAVNAVMTELVEARGFDKAAFLRHHPGGSIGNTKAPVQRDH